MNQPLLLLPLLAACLGAGCARSGSGARLPVNADRFTQEKTAKFVLMDSRAQRSVTSAGLQERILEDGRLEVAAILRNRENRRLQVQAQCVFKGPEGVGTGDETPWENVILTENGMETLRFTSLNSQARNYTVRVREAR
ncbi:MAG: hypothetical protein ACKOET_00905 [Verrucomicrobiota bacterium]